MSDESESDRETALRALREAVQALDEAEAPVDRLVSDGELKIAAGQDLHETRQQTERLYRGVYEILKGQSAPAVVTWDEAEA